MDRLARQLLEIFAVAMDLPHDYFADKVNHHTSTLGVAHYPDDIELTAADASPLLRRGYVVAFPVPDGADSSESDTAGWSTTCDLGAFKGRLVAGVVVAGRPVVVVFPSDPGAPGATVIAKRPSASVDVLPCHVRSHPLARICT